LNTLQIRYPPRTQKGSANRGEPMAVPRKSSEKPTNERRRVKAQATTTPDSTMRTPPSNRMSESLTCLGLSLPCTRAAGFKWIANAVRRIPTAMPIGAAVRARNRSRSSSLLMRWAISSRVIVSS